MCEICMQSPCNSQCPNADHPHAIYTCKDCGDAIAAGEEFVELNDGYYHFGCLDSKSVKEILELCGYSRETAEEYTPA